MLVRISTSVIAVLVLTMAGRNLAASNSGGPPKFGPHSIGGVVFGPTGPEAGVWVIAETTDLGNRLVKVVVTDDQGRFVMPDLPEAKYKVWSRGYGLIDSKPLNAEPGKSLNLTVSAAQTPVQAAQVYPANYWFSLMKVPAASEFPGTGPQGNGISPAFKVQEQWIAHMVENCQFCHQLGTHRTRTLPDTGNPLRAWEQRVSVARDPDGQFFEGDTSYHGRHYGERMSNLVTQFGRERGLEMFADWTTRIAKGDVPPAPPRPTGIERNLVVTMWDMAGGRFMHDSSSSDKLNPTVNAGGPIYGYALMSGMVIALDPVSGKEQQFKLTDKKGDYFKNANDHTGTIDSQGRVWMSTIGSIDVEPEVERQTKGDNPDWCTNPENKFAQYFPRAAKAARLTIVFDPKTKKSELLPTCFGTHHLNFDKNERLYFSGDTDVVGWIDVALWDKTKDLAKATGWCPMVLDTNGDGKITPDRTQWNVRLDGVGGGGEGSFGHAASQGGASLDPSKDTRITGFNYGMGISPKDQSYWAAKYSPYFPSGIARVEPGPNPPLTCKTEYYEPPKIKGVNVAYNARGVDVDADGVAWVAFGTGAIGRFDRSRCKVLNGPAATGQHCPEGWEIIQSPGPKLQGIDIGSDFFYLVFVDHHNTFGLGPDVPIFPNSSGDELLAYLPKEKKLIHLRVPYPLGFYSRGVDGRIDNEKAGWKGRGLWSTNNVIALWHQEDGEGSPLYAAHFQMRPNPLAD